MDAGLSDTGGTVIYYFVHTVCSGGNGAEQKAKPSAKTHRLGLLSGFVAYGAAVHAAVFGGCISYIESYFLKNTVFVRFLRKRLDAMGNYVVE